MFKNVTFFKVPESPGVPDGAELSTLSPVGPMELTSVGLVPVNAEGDLCPAVGGVLNLRVGFEKKKLPASAINRKLKPKLAEIERNEGRRPGGRERKRMRDDVIAEMLPNAAVATSSVGVMVFADGLIALDTASRGAAEQTISFLRGLYGSLPALPLNPERDPAAVLTSWLQHEDTAPAGASVSDVAWLYGGVGTIKLAGVDLRSEPVQAHLGAGALAERVRVDAGDFEATICEDMVVRKLVVDVDEDEDSAFEADALLQQAAVRSVYALLQSEFKLS